MAWLAKAALRDAHRLLEGSHRGRLVPGRCTTHQQVAHAGYIRYTGFLRPMLEIVVCQVRSSASAAS